MYYDWIINLQLNLKPNLVFFLICDWIINLFELKLYGHFRNSFVKVCAKFQFNRSSLRSVSHSKTDFEMLKTTRVSDSVLGRFGLFGIHFAIHLFYLARVCPKNFLTSSVCYLEFWRWGCNFGIQDKVAWVQKSNRLLFTHLWSPIRSFSLALRGYIKTRNKTKKTHFMVARNIEPYWQ